MVACVAFLSIILGPLEHTVEFIMKPSFLLHFTRLELGAIHKICDAIFANSLFAQLNRRAFKEYCLQHFYC